MKRWLGVLAVLVISSAQAHAQSWEIQSVAYYGSENRIALDPSGQPHIAYIGDGALSHTVYTGSGWHSDAVSNVGGIPRIAIGADSTVYVAYSVWQQQTQQGESWLSSFDGTTWAKEKVGDWNGRLCLALDPNGAADVRSDVDCLIWMLGSSGCSTNNYGWTNQGENNYRNNGMTAPMYTWAAAKSLAEEATAFPGSTTPTRYCGGGKGNAPDTCSASLELGYAYEQIDCIWPGRPHEIDCYVYAIARANWHPMGTAKILQDRWALWTSTPLAAEDTTVTATHLGSAASPGSDWIPEPGLNSGNSHGWTADGHFVILKWENGFQYVGE